MNTSDITILRVSYMRLTEAPSVPHPHTGAESIALEQMTLAAYLALYRRVGGPLRLLMPEAALEILPHADLVAYGYLGSSCSHSCL